MKAASVELQFGAKHDIQIVVIQPLFEEANRTRRLLASVMRSLDAAGIGTSIPMLPGTGESLTPIAGVTLDDWRASLRAFAEALPKPPLAVSVRGGALLDDAWEAPGRWRLNPMSGPIVLKDHNRLSAIRDIDSEPVTDSVPALLLADLAQAVASDERVHVAAIAFDGAPLWRRAEPGDDPALAAAMAADIAAWAKRCGAH